MTQTYNSKIDTVGYWQFYWFYWFYWLPNCFLHLDIVPWSCDHRALATWSLAEKRAFLPPAAAAPRRSWHHGARRPGQAMTQPTQLAQPKSGKNGKIYVIGRICVRVRTDAELSEKNLQSNCDCPYQYWVLNEDDPSIGTTISSP